MIFSIAELLNSHLLIYPIAKMHVLQPKHTKIKPEEAEKLMLNLNISKSQLPKISSKDPAIPKDCDFGDVIKIERKGRDGSLSTYYRVVV